MMAELALLPSRRTIRRLDVAVALTTAVFVALGVLAGLELARLARLGAGLMDAAAALDQAFLVLRALSEVPLVGPAVDPLATDVRQTAISTRTGGVDATAAISRLAVVIGLSIALIPLPALLTVYLPLRLARAREVRGLRRLLTGGRPVDEMLVAHLAHGATTRLPYPRLRQVSRDPWADLIAGRHHQLAAAELRRLGLRPPPDWSVPPGQASVRDGA